MSLIPSSFGYYSMKVFRLYEDYKNAYPETDDENFRLLCCGAFLFRGFCYDEEKIIKILNKCLKENKIFEVKELEWKGYTINNKGEKIEEPMPMDWWGGRLVYKKYKPK